MDLGRLANIGWGTALLALLACACAPEAAAGSIRKWVDAKGVTHYSNVPGDGGAAVLPARLPAMAMTGRMTPKRPIHSARPRVML